MQVRNLGHVVLRVRDAEKSSEWYKSVLGLHETARFGRQMFFLSASEDASHELALMGLGPDAPPPEERRVGLYHVGWQLGSLEDLQAFRRKLDDLGVEVAGIGDHGISLGVYLKDPDGNELEVFYELPRSQWPESGNIFAGSFPNPVEL